MNDEDRLCFIVQRYGLEVNGGSELHCRQLAEHMLSRYSNIDVLTTKAIDYMTWANEYEADEEDINGIHVIRFPVERERNQDSFNAINELVYRNILPESRELEWVEKQGPYVPALIRYLREHIENYKVFIFMTYLYYTTVIGVPEVASKAIVIPTAHNEPFLKMKIYENVFCRPCGFFFNTEEEKNMIHERFHNEDIKWGLGGVGVELPSIIDGNRFKKKYKLDDYLLYVGRIDDGKNCRELFDYFIRYRAETGRDTKLVLMGKAVIEIPEEPGIVPLGFVDDQDKFDGIAETACLVVPSKYESLSMVVLEAMSEETLVLVNGECEVLKGHCRKSNGALYYENYYEFESCLEYYRHHPDTCRRMRKNARQYVENNYQWSVIVDRLCELIDEAI